MAKSQSKSINTFVDANENPLDQDQITKLLRDLDYKHQERLISMLMQGKSIGNNKELAAALERAGVWIKTTKSEADAEGKTLSVGDSVATLVQALHDAGNVATNQEEFSKMIAGSDPKIVVALVQLPSGACEVIINSQDIKGKIEYYATRYDADFCLIANKEVKILGLQIAE